jgi:hypothetical protein
MNSRFYLLCLTVFCCASAYGQQNTQSFLAIEGSKGNDLQYTVAASYNYIWLLGKQRRFEIGTGGRFTSYSGGTSRYYFSAPASIVSGGSENIDTVSVTSPTIYSVNLLFNMAYRITGRIAVGLNIDVIGTSFGSEKLGTFMSGSTNTTVPVKPTPFNVLLGNNNDHGSLNSNFFVRYHVNDKLAVKAGVQHLLTEYSTSTEVQQQPSPNDRFRSKSTMFSAGILFYF